MNCPEPDEVHSFNNDSVNMLEVNRELVTTEEVKKAIKRLKNGKAPGVDGIQAELLKHGGEQLMDKLTELCNQIWRKGEVPRDCCDGIIIPIQKKGNLRDCNNRRGITLLSVPGKVLCSIILDRLKMQLMSS